MEMRRQNEERMRGFFLTEILFRVGDIHTSHTGRYEGRGANPPAPPSPPPKKQTNKTTNANDVFIVKVLHFFVCSGTALHLSALARDFEHYLIHIVSSLSGLLRVE